MMGLLVPVLALCLGQAEALPFYSGVLWADAHEVEHRPVSVPRTTEYAIWVWSKRGEDARLTVSGLTMSGRPRGRTRSPGEFAWFHLGTVSLRAGRNVVVLSDNIAAIAMSAHAGFDALRAADVSRVFGQPMGAGDRRAGEPRHTDTVFTMPHFASKKKWETYARGLRRRILLSSGLWPLPERTALNPQVYDRIEHEDYSVEKVYFEARPGLYVTGNLYRPTGEGPFPAVLCPHGHWGGGRLENSAENSIPGRCITLARMGIVALSVDMLGYNDSCQMDHRWSSQKDKLWGIHPFAIQLWSNIRALDFLQQLHDVQPDRIGCTGASGGGTQTFALMAVDDRVKVAAPVNMISSTMQGGCVCENAPLLRLDNSNMEIGALMAPRPLLLVSATGDWTRETPRVEYPSIREIYKLYDRTDRVQNVHIDAGHNYNRDSREAMYQFFGKWLLAGGRRWEEFSEPPFTVESNGALRVFPWRVPPPGALSDPAVRASIASANREKWRVLLPSGTNALDKFRKNHGGALEEVLGVRVPSANDLTPRRYGFTERDEYVAERWVLGRRGEGDAIPAILFRAPSAERQDAVLIVHGQGKSHLLDPVTGGPGPFAAGLLELNKAVLIIDAFLLGEHHSPFEQTKRQTAGAFLDTFEPTRTGCRVQDVVTALAYLQSRRDLSGIADVVGLGEGGVWALFASAIDGRVRKTLVDANRFDTSDDSAWVQRHYVPCLRAIGDVSTAGALIAPRSLWIVNTARRFDTKAIARAFQDGAHGRFFTVTDQAPLNEWIAALQ